MAVPRTAVDKWPGPAGRNIGYDSPGTDALPVTTSDTAEMEYVSRGLMIQTAGNIKVQMRDAAIDSPVVLAVPAGFLPLRVRQVWTTGTTATGLSYTW